MTGHLLQTLLTKYIIFPSTLTYYVKHVQKEKEMESMTYFCSFSGSWLQTREFFICWKCNLQNTFKIETVFCVHRILCSQQWHFWQCEVHENQSEFLLSCFYKLMCPGFIPSSQELFYQSLYSPAPTTLLLSLLWYPYCLVRDITASATLEYELFRPRHNHVFWPADVQSNYWAHVDNTPFSSTLYLYW